MARRASACEPPSLEPRWPGCAWTDQCGWPADEAALKGANVKYEMFRYSGTEHGFNNDTTRRYDEAAAKLAWDRTIAFFDKSLRG